MNSGFIRREEARKGLLLQGPLSLVLPRAALCVFVHCGVENCSWLLLEGKEEREGREGREGEGGEESERRRRCTKGS